MRALVALAALLVTAGGASAWQVEPRARIAAAPVDTNAAIERAVIRCRRDLVIGIETKARRLRPKRDYREEEALFDTLFDKAAAVIDGERFPLGVGGANDDATLYLFASDREGFKAALADAEALRIEFDILPETAKDGEGFDTFAEFDASALGEAMSAVGRACAA